MLYKRIEFIIYALIYVEYDKARSYTMILYNINLKKKYLNSIIEQSIDRRTNAHSEVVFNRVNEYKMQIGLHTHLTTQLKLFSNNSNVTRIHRNYFFMISS